MGKRILKRKTPSGKITIIIKKKKGDYAKCAICKKILNGVVREHPRDLARINKTQKRVSRIYGGYLCHKCLERLLRSKIRKNILKNI
ncbi:MAG: 50S ribosomal protein L34e [Nanopusillaceae archaeon]